MLFLPASLLVLSYLVVDTRQKTDTTNEFFVVLHSL